MNPLKGGPGHRWEEQPRQGYALGSRPATNSQDAWGLSSGGTRRPGTVSSRVGETEFTPPWVPTNGLVLSLEEIGYGHQQHTIMNIFIYTKSGCPNCVAAKQLLKSRDLKFVECDMDDKGVREAFMFAHPEVKQMPQIFINDERVGGLAGLKVALNQLSLL